MLNVVNGEVSTPTADVAPVTGVRAAEHASRFVIGESRGSAVSRQTFIGKYKAKD